MTENLRVPVSPESIVDFAWGLTFFFSDNTQEKKYGEDLKSKWDDLLNKLSTDSQTRNLLQSINAAMSATIYNLAQIRRQAVDHFAFLDSVQTQNLKDLDDLATLSKDAESIASRLAGVSLGGGVTFIALRLNTLGSTNFDLRAKNRKNFYDTLNA